jgi:putative membrane protein (TIGR04086 family)
MNIRWMAVLTGFIVDIFATMLLFMTVFPQTIFAAQPLDMNNPLPIGLGLFATAIGGYVAGRIGLVQRVLHGLLVGVVGILMTQIQMMYGDSGMSRTAVLALAAGCVAGALGGALSHYPANREQGV